MFIMMLVMSTLCLYRRHVYAHTHTHTRTQSPSISLFLRNMLAHRRLLACSEIKPKLFI